MSSTVMAQPTFIIRRGTLADANVLAELGARTFSETFAPVNEPEDIAAYLMSSFSQAKQTEELADARSIFLIVESDKVAVGYATLRADEVPDCVTGELPIELVRLYVAQEWLGSGVGQALMQACINEVREKGYQTLWLGVWEHNQRARAFYRKWGFQEVGNHVFQLGSDSQTDLVMHLSI
jgi:ribosomal protein S18 acetylase RimI-like enzyme